MKEAHIGMVHIENGFLKYRIVNDNNTPITGSETLQWDDPHKFAQKLCQIYGVPIYGAESVDFKEVKP